MKIRYKSTTIMPTKQKRNYAWICAALIAITFISLSAVYAAAAVKGEGALVGFVSSVEGKATLKRAHFKEAQLDGMNALRVGDVVRVQKKSTVTVNLCSLSQRIRIQGETVFSVAKGGLKITKGKPGVKSKMNENICRTLMASTAKFDEKKYISSDVSESAGAMSVMGMINSKESKKAEEQMMYEMERARAEEADSAKSYQKEAMLELETATDTQSVASQPAATSTEEIPGATPNPEAYPAAPADMPADTSAAPEPSSF